MTWEEFYALCTRYCAGEITADQYFDAVDEYSKQVVEEMVRAEGRRRRRS